MNSRTATGILKWAAIVGTMSCSIAWGQEFAHPHRPLDIQGHRGFRGKWPENTWMGMKAALEVGVTTLEMDVVMSKDGEVMLSHEPWMNPEICEWPGIAAGNSEPLNLYRMDYAQIRAYNCGSPLGHPRFPQQRSVVAYKPLLREIMDSLIAYCNSNGRRLPYLNIEIKSKNAWDGLYHPPVQDYVHSVLDIIQRSGLKDRCLVQSFDPRVPVLVNMRDSTLVTVCLVEYRRVWSRSLYAQAVMCSWGQGSRVYSPHFRMLTRRTVKKLQSRNIKVIPWTVNKPLVMKRLMRWGVDGIITDYPDILVGLRQTRAGQTP